MVMTYTDRQAARALAPYFMNDSDLNPTDLDCSAFTDGWHKVVSDLKSGVAVSDIRMELTPEQLALLVAIDPDAPAEKHPSIDESLAHEMADAQLLEDLASKANTDLGNAESLQRLYSDQLRFVRTNKKGAGYWLTWEEHRWVEDRRGATDRAVWRMARLRSAASQTIIDDDERDKALGWARRSENRYPVRAALETAQSLPCFATLPDDYDQDAWLLGCANGVLDLRTGKLRDGRREDMITMSTGIAYDPDAKSPRWERFLLEIFDGDTDLVRFVQKAAGYSLTGDTSFPALFFCHGSGRNGKSTLLNTLRTLAGDYGWNAPFSTFEASKGGSIPNDLAAMAGKRMVTASETNESTRLNEARIKALTGNDPQTARFLHGEFFTFEPVSHTWLAMNHRPQVRDDSEGMWARVKLLPFEVSFAGREDPSLDMTLKAELSGILNWAVQGCLAYQQEGLRPEPEAVRMATAEYRADSDNFRRFIDEACIITSTAQVGTKQIRTAYEAWCEECGERPINWNRQCCAKLRDMGCIDDRIFVGGNRVRGWVGVGLQDTAIQDAMDTLDS